MVSDAIESACVACGGELVFFGEREGYRYHACRACGSIQLVPLPSASDLDRAYAEAYADARHIESNPVKRNRSSRTYFESLTRVLTDHEVEGPVAEVGAGWGGLCEVLTARGFAYHGVEPSERMSRYCRERGLPVAQGTIGDLPETEYAALVLASVFEHLVDHRAWLVHANGLLRAGGLFVSLQPTAPFARLMGTVMRLGRRGAPLPQLHQIFCPPWHVALFSLAGMKTLAEEHGFELIEVRPAPQGREPGIAGLVQRALEAVNRAGWSLTGRRWPLVTSHIFVFRKLRGLPDSE